MNRALYKMYRWLKRYLWHLGIRQPLFHFDQRLKTWEWNRSKEFWGKYGPPILRWYYLTFRVRCKRYPNRLQLFSLALKAGAIVRKNFGKTLEADWKEDRTPVTCLDRAISSLYIRKVNRRFQHISVYGEEGASRQVDNSTVALVIDEMDGTIPGMLGVSASTVVATVVVNGVPVAAMTHDPVLRRTWYAEKCRGSYFWRGGWLQWFRMWLADHGLAFLWEDHGMGRRLHVSNEPLENSINSLMWWAGSVGNLDQVRPRLNKIPGAQWHNFCAVAISGGLIAEGRMVASVFGGRHARETMAMQLQVEEAGGWATDLFKRPLVYEEDPDNFGQINFIDGHIICNTRENLERLAAMVEEANFPFEIDHFSSRLLETVEANDHNYEEVIEIEP